MCGKKDAGNAPVSRRRLLWPACLAATCLVALASAAGATGRVTASPPVNAAAPTISGVVRSGQTLSVSPGSWSGLTPITFSIAWERCGPTGANCSLISGATALTFGLTSADVGSTIRVLVTASNSDGWGQALTSATAVVAHAGSVPASTAQPNPSGTPQDGQTVTVDNGSWSGDQPMTYTYQWQRCTASNPVCTDIPGATAQSYKAVTADVGYTLRAKVTATNFVGSTLSTSNLTTVVQAAGVAPVNTALPLIVGRPVAGTTLRAGVGIWAGATAGGYAYGWSRCNSTGTGCSSIPGATGPTYLLTGQDVGKTIRLTVTATNQSGSTSAVSVATNAVAPAIVPGLRLGATLTVGQVVPRPFGTKAGASGKFTATLTGTTLRWTLRFVNLTGPVTATGINFGAPGRSGPLLFGLSGRIVSPATGTSALTKAEVAKLVSGNAYVSILTARNPGGELRGRVTPAL